MKLVFEVVGVLTVIRKRVSRACSGTPRGTADALTLSSLGTDTSLMSAADKIAGRLTSSSNDRRREWVGQYTTRICRCCRFTRYSAWPRVPLAHRVKIVLRFYSHRLKVAQMSAAYYRASLRFC